MLAKPFFLLTAFVVGLLVSLPATSRAAVFYPTSMTLANGLQVVVVPNHLAPAVNQMVWYKVGSADEALGQTGLAHYLEHLMFRGTKNQAPGEFSKTIALQGGSDNAFTSFDYTAYFETVAADRLPMIMSMEADRMQNLQIAEETAKPELHVVLDERQQRTDNNPEGRFTEKTRNLLMPHYGYGIPVIGWKKEIEKFTTKDAQKFYQSHYAPNNAVVIISGDVTPDQVMKLAASIYGAVPKRVVGPRRELGEPSMPSKTSYKMTDAGVEQAQIVAEYVVPSYATQKGKEAYAFEVLAEALDSGEVGVLYKALGREQKLASGIGTNYDPDARGQTVFTVAASPRQGVDPAKLESALLDALKKFAETGLEAQTIEKAKDRLRRSAIFARDSLMMPGYAFGMALTTGRTVDDVEQWPDRISAVTVEEVNASLKDLVANPRMLVSELMPDSRATQAQREAAQPVISHSMGVR